MSLPESAESQLQKTKVSSVEKKLLLGKIAQMNNLPTPSANIRATICGRICRSSSRPN